jgi:hypothetical protein
MSFEVFKDLIVSCVFVGIIYYMILFVSDLFSYKIPDRFNIPIVIILAMILRLMKSIA